MSQENVGIVRAAIDALNKGDLDAYVKDAAPDYEFDFSRAVGPVSGVFKLDQMRALMEDEFFGQWEAVRMEADELIDAGEHVVVTLATSSRGRDGIEVTSLTTWVFTFREGKIVRQCYYQDKAEALEAAGLSE
jgi:ketosteroid isomerase-like protein